MDLVDLKSIERFCRDLKMQVATNRIKWNQIHGIDGHRQHTILEWQAIAQEQMGQLAMAVVFGDVNKVKEEIMHVAAVLFEMHEKILT